MDEDTKKIEAILFTTGRFMTLEEIALACGLGSAGLVHEKLEEIRKHYNKLDSAITLNEHEGRWKLNIKKEFGFLANKLVSSSEFDAPTTKTLAVIAYRNPALQSDIIKIRGNKAYDHVSRLREEGLIVDERHGRTRLLKLTQKFYEYFDTADVDVKGIFKIVEEKVKKDVAEKAGMTPEEVAEKEKLLEERHKEKEVTHQQDSEQVEENALSPANNTLEGEEPLKELKP